jgi:hypothetical protein
MCLLGHFESDVNPPSRTAIAINPRGVMYCRVVPRHGAAVSPKTAPIQQPLSSGQNPGRCGQAEARAAPPLFAMSALGRS